jgi:YD repeat-containing protein
VVIPSRRSRMRYARGSRKTRMTCCQAGYAFRLPFPPTPAGGSARPNLLRGERQPISRDVSVGPDPRSAQGSNERVRPITNPSQPSAPLADRASLGSSHLRDLSHGRITDASDLLPVRACRHQSEAAAAPSEHRTSLRRRDAQSRFLSHRDPQSRSSSYRDAQSRSSSHRDAQSRLSTCPFRDPLLPDRPPNVAIGSLALAAAPVTAASRLLTSHRHTVSTFGPPLAMGPPDAQRPRQVQTKPSIHVRESVPTCPRDRGRAPTRGGPYV